MLLGRIFSSVRYLATVRRAIGMPRSLRISTISLSLNGVLLSSFFTRSRIASLTLVLLIDSPVRNLFAVQDDVVFAMDFFHRDIWQHIILGGSGEDGAGPRVELGDVVGAFLHLLDTDSHSARNLGKTAFSEVGHVIGNDLVF